MGPKKTLKTNPKSSQDKKNQELERRIDEMLSVEQNSNKKTAAKPPVQPSKSDVVDKNEEIDSKSGAPLLPTEKLPNLTGAKVKPLGAAEEVKAEEASFAPTPNTVPAPIPAEKTQFKVEPAVPWNSEPFVKDDIGLEDPATDKAVDEIIANDADQLLNKNDEDIQREERSLKSPTKPKSKNILKLWWRNKVLRNLTLLVFFSAIAALIALPQTRYAILNFFGVRVSSSISVIDEATGQPIKNADFALDDLSVKTNEEGRASIGNLELGPAKMVINKSGYAEISKDVTLGWGSNPLGEMRAKAVGIQTSFVVLDYVSKQPIKASATSGEADSQSNDKGEILLTLPNLETDEVKVKLQANQYRDEELTVKLSDKKVLSVEMVPSRKHVYISKRGGTYDLYKIDIDGKNEKKVFSGTGKEKLETLLLSVHPTRNFAVLASQRDGVSGDQANSLNLINLDDDSILEITKSEQIQVFDWVGDRLIYEKVTKGADQASADRRKIMNFNIESKKEQELASANVFNNVLVVNESIFYSLAQHEGVQVGLFKINAEGNYRKSLIDSEVWNVFRTSYDKLAISAIGQEWYDLNLENDNLTKAGGPPSSLKSRLYVDNKFENTSIWTEERDGKGTLIAVNMKDKVEKTLTSQSGLKSPMRWLDNTHIVYRISNNQETADYVISTKGGDAKKIRDVTDTPGADRWYYY